MFRWSHLWFVVTFGDRVTKIIRNLCFHFARQDGQDGKNRKENHTTKVTKIPKIKRRKYGMNEKHWWLNWSWRRGFSVIFADNFSVIFFEELVQPMTLLKYTFWKLLTFIKEKVVFRLCLSSMSESQWFGHLYF